VFERKDIPMIPEWWMNVLLFVSALLASIVIYCLSKNQYQRAIWLGFSAAVVLLLAIALYLQRDFQIKESQRASLNRPGKENQREILKAIDDSKREVINTISSILAREKRKVKIDQDTEKRSEQKYQLLVNKNTNFIPIDTQKGTMLTLFKVVVDQIPSKRFYLLDLVGDLERNRISLFIEGGLVTCQILTHTGKKESLSGSLTRWARGDVHTVIMTWNISKQRSTLYIDGKVVAEKTIKDLQFDVLGPVAFGGTDFEGDFPAQGIIEFIKLPKELLDLTFADAVLGDPKAKIKNGILLKFKQMKAKVGQPLPDKWLTSTYFPNLTAKEQNVFNEAVSELIEAGFVEDMRGNLKLANKGTELLQ